MLQGLNVLLAAGKDAIIGGKKFINEYRENVRLKKHALKLGLPAIDWEEIPQILQGYLAAQIEINESRRKVMENRVPPREIGVMASESIKTMRDLGHSLKNANFPLNDQLKFHKRLDLLLDQAIVEAVTLDKRLLARAFREMVEDLGLGCAGPLVNLSVDFKLKQEPEKVIEYFVLRSVNSSLDNRAELSYRILQKILDYRAHEAIVP